jgi:uncharacterized protein (DUF58 family)
MPTLYGVSFGLICLLLFGIAFASTNNAVYFLCFFMVALASQSLILTNRNIEKVKVVHLVAEDFFADEPRALRLSIHNPTPEDLQNIQFEFSEKFQILVKRLKAGERREVLIPFISASFGFIKIPDLKISSDFPYHFSRSWKKYYGNLNICVYPPRRGSAQFAKTAFSQRGLELQSLDDFKGHREYQDSDSPRSIDWKVSARLQKTMVKEYDPQSSRKITLRWEDCPQALERDKQSQLSLWIDLADKNNYEYALELPNRALPFGSGPQHKTQCLRALV